MVADIAVNNLSVPNSRLTLANMNSLNVVAKLAKLLRDLVPVENGRSC